MKVIDILNEGAAGEVGERVLKSILGHSTWTAAQKIAFKDSVETCTDVIEQMLLREQDITSPANINAAWNAIKSRIEGTPWANKAFVQEIFDVSAAEARDRIARRAGELTTPPVNPKPTDTPKPTKPTDTTKPALTGAQRATSNAKWLLGVGAFGAAAYDVVFNSLAEYYNNQAEFLSRVRAGKLTADQAKQADNQQKMILIANIAAAVVFPTAVTKIPSWAAGIAGWLLRVLKITKPPPIRLRQTPSGDLLQITQADTQSAVGNSLAATKYAAWGAWLYLLNGNEPIKGTADYKLYDPAGNVTGTVGRDLTPKELVAWFAINKMWGVDVVQWAFDAFNTLWNSVLPDVINYDTQKQSIEKAAGKPVTPNEFAKPPKVKQHDGVTLQGWD